MRLRTESRREAILAVASQVFREAGFERASMAQIAERAGGSKATLYGYFPSKEALFVAVTRAVSDEHLRLAVAELSDTAEGLEPVLVRFGVALVTFITSEQALAGQRMVLAEAGRSDVGASFWNAGPSRAQQALSDFLASRMSGGDLRAADPTVAAQHLMGLLTAEHTERLFVRESAPIGGDAIQRSVASAVAVFMRGYRP